jgi:ribosomal-protein-alanine N-acetyltransferase
MEKLRIRDEGVAQRYLEINGVWEDHIRYGFTAEEWTDRRAELAEAWLP